MAAKIQIKRGKTKKSITNFQLCLENNVNHFGASIYLANLLIEFGEGEKAVRYFENAIRING
jgi:hypothetical protein